MRDWKICLVNKILLFALTISLTATSLVYAQEEVMEEPDLVILENNPWTTIKEGYQQKSVTGKRRGSGLPFQLVFLKFNPYKFQLRIRHFSELSERPVYVGAYTEEKNNIVAAINGGYFDPEGKHLGFLKVDKKVFSKNVATHPIYSGVIVPDKKPIIIHRDDFKPEKVDNALQVGPLLIRNGKVNPGLRNTERIHYRSGIGCDKSGMFILYATNTNYSGISWEDLVDVLKMSDFDFLNVINLDGGGSTQLFYRNNGEVTFYRGITPVPTALVVERRKGVQ